MIRKIKDYYKKTREKKAQKKWDIMLSDCQILLSEQSIRKARKYIHLFKTIAQNFDFCNNYFDDQQLEELYFYKASIVKTIIFYFKNEKYLKQEICKLTKLLLYPKEHLILFGYNYLDDIATICDKNQLSSVNTRMSNSLDFFYEELWKQLITIELEASGKTFNRIKIWFCSNCKIDIKTSYNSKRQNSKETVYSVVIIVTLVFALMVYTKNAPSLDIVFSEIQSKLNDNDLVSSGLFFYSAFYISKMDGLRSSHELLKDNLTYKKISSNVSKFDIEQFGNCKFNYNDIHLIEHLINLKLDDKTRNYARYFCDIKAKMLNKNQVCKSKKKKREDRINSIFKGDL